MKPLLPQTSPRPSSRPPASKPGSGGKNAIFGVLLLAIAGLGAFAWFQYRSNQELRAKADLAEKAAQEAAAKAKQIAAAQPAPADDQASNPGDNRQQGMAAISNLLANPQARQAMDAMAGNAIDNLYAGLFQQLNLDATQTAALRDLMVKRNSAATDAFAAAAQSGDLTGARQAVEAAQAGVDQQIQGMLGASDYQQYQDYTANLRGTLGARGFGAQAPAAGLPAGN
jgi:hypothetical protein